MDILNIKDNLTEITKKKVEKSVRFKDVIGIDEFKEELIQVVDFLKHRKIYLSSGATIPKGVLLTGPPGCGKTLLARAISNEANVPFYAVNASQLLHSTSGVSTKLINGLFDNAKKNKQGAIIFIDEIDTFEARSSDGGSINSVVNQLLTCMDGFHQTENVIVIAATNRPEVLDSALTRSGRFDFKIKIGLPFFENRVKILDFYLQKVKKDDSINIQDLGKLTVRFSPAEIKNLVNLGVLNAIKEDRKKATQQDMITAFEKIKMGIKNSNNLSLEMLSKVALKEAAKAVVSFNNKSLPQINKISINTFDSDSSGKGIYLDKIDTTNYSKKEILSFIEFFLTAKAVEEVLDNDQLMTSIPNKDFEQASSLAYRFVGELGFVENFSFLTIDEKYLSNFTKHRNEKKAEEILNECYLLAKSKVKSLKDDIFKVKAELLEKEQLTRQDIENILIKN